jgi:hypothetical protein
VRSQLANRLVLSLKEQSDIQSALAGVQDVGMWEKIVGTIPVRTVAVIGDAIRVPTVIDIMTYDRRGTAGIGRGGPLFITNQERKRRPFERKIRNGLVVEGCLCLGISGEAYSPYERTSPVGSPITPSGTA